MVQILDLSPTCTGLPSINLLNRFTGFAAHTHIFGRKMSSVFADISFSLGLGFFRILSPSELKNEEFDFSASRCVWLKDRRGRGAKRGHSAQSLRSSIPSGAHRIRKLPLTSFFALRTTYQTYLAAKVYSVTYPSWRALSPHYPFASWMLPQPASCWAGKGLMTGRLEFSSSPRRRKLLVPTGLGFSFCGCVFSFWNQEAKFA